MNTLEDLYYGNLFTHEKCAKLDDEVKELLILLNRNEEKLTATLTESQKETFEKYKDCNREISEISERETLHIHADNVQFRRSLLAGCADALFVLKKSNRTQGNATLFCTGRDIEDREIELAFSKEDCTWKMTADSAENPNMLLPDEMNLLIEMMKAKKYFNGSNAEFLERYNAYSGKNLSARILKRIKIINQINRERMMKEYRQSATA